MHRIWEIPDLLHTLQEDLGRNDHIQLMRVCHLLLDSCIPLLWESIDLIRLEDLYDLQSQDIVFKVSRTFRAFAALHLHPRSSERLSQDPP